MLGGSCSTCCASCEDLALTSGIAFPSVSVRWSTSGFSGGASVSGGGAFYGGVRVDRQSYYRALYEFTVDGQFYESSGSELLLPGTKPFITTQAEPGYVPFPAYIKSWPTVLTEDASRRVNPYIAVRFRCGSQTSPFSSGNYLWAAGYVNLPVFTSTWQYTKTWADSREPWALVKNYATSEVGGSINSFYVQSPSDGYYASFANRNDNWLNDRPTDGYGNLLIYTTSRPQTLPTGPFFGPSVSLNKYAESGEIAGYEIIRVSVPPTFYRYMYVNFETPYALCGEFNAGQYMLYGNTLLTSSIYGATSAKSSNFNPQVSRQWEPGPNASRMPWFMQVGPFSWSITPGWKQSFTAVGISQNPTTGQPIIIQVPGPPESYGIWYPTPPGVSYTETLMQGPSIEVVLNPQ